ncbi:hypothetical protein K402DRAFT_116336 [Aulographum hederae CBS 113979]|uniref:Uncharacterized protein n=1 Tax=Aulographum hederae CBS 113979 TaxID=1176131 RepID=A0A6G1GW20_9PEZI|nr:hypothetical protein K402DRAFT_116336 [Aulographum hederae CBS 113979]
MTLDQAVLSLQEKHFAAGQTNVAISRVRRLSGLLFEEPFDHERLKSAMSKVAQARQEDYDRRRVQHL